MDDEPDTACLANFRLSRWDEAGAVPETVTGTGALPSKVPVGGQWQFGVDEWGNRRGVEKSQRDFINQPGVDGPRRTGAESRSDAMEISQLRSGW